MVNFNFKFVSNIRMMLYDNFYSNIINVSTILDSILQNFDLFTINYNSNNHSIELKIKKTNIRKNGSFSHTATYYYSIFNPIFYEVFLNNKNLLKNIIDNNIEKYNFTGQELDFILDPNNVSLLFNITTMSDNIVIIYL